MTQTEMIMLPLNTQENYSNKSVFYYTFYTYAYLANTGLPQLETQKYTCSVISIDFCLSIRMPSWQPQE